MGTLSQVSLPRAVIPNPDWFVQEGSPEELPRNITQFERESYEVDPQTGALGFRGRDRKWRPMQGWRLPEPTLDAHGNLLQLGDGKGPNQEQARWLWRLGLNRTRQEKDGEEGKICGGGKAQRLALCGCLADKYQCTECGEYFKQNWRCGLRTCPGCAPKNFDRLFRKYVVLDSLIPARLKCEPGWGWKILDLSFWHDGRLPSSQEVRNHAKVYCNVVERAMRVAMFAPDWDQLECSPEQLPGVVTHLEQQARKKFAVLRKCKPVLDEKGNPRYGSHGWPLGQKPSGEIVEMRCWMVVKVIGWYGQYIPGTGKESLRKRIRSEAALGSTVSPKTRRRLLKELDDFIEADVEAAEQKMLASSFGEQEGQSVTAQRKFYERGWRLRPAWTLLRSGELGFDNTNHHYHGCAFAPYVPQKFLSELFKQESKRLLGVESYRAVIGRARDRNKKPLHGAEAFRVVLAHAFKYVKKLPASTPEALARIEVALDGTRVVALLGALYGVELPQEKKSSPHCPCCKSETARLSLVERFVPMDAVANLPDVPEEVAAFTEDFEAEVFAARAP